MNTDLTRVTTSQFRRCTQIKHYAHDIPVIQTQNAGVINPYLPLSEYMKLNDNAYMFQYLVRINKVGCSHPCMFKHIRRVVFNLSQSTEYGPTSWEHMHILNITPPTHPL